jgi:hypothetical protein
MSAVDPPDAIKIEFIIEEREQLHPDDLRTLAKIIHRHDPKRLNFYSAGATVNLKNLPPSVINALYTFTRMKVEKS